ncbi:hypothetical protein [Sphingobium sp. YR768]|uniref:hypothetical protein n=1 Tax=Sphingobium sp. YR768 TaxID=1884365 RepID=UPI0008C39989|nr:hypothetical protein [Sphingobium sp. YR768]SEQ47221.1 hypothetical protein SAMN05518866_10142 [Sphingobium sp. YR768]
MSEIEDIKQTIEASWPALPGAELSIRLLDFVVHLPEPETRLLTMPMLAKGIGLKGIDDNLLTAITILISSRLELLQARAMFIEDDDSEHDFGPADLAEARREGALTHPETGEAIQDFEDRLYPFFVPTDRLKAIMQSEHGA